MSTIIGVHGREILDMNMDEGTQQAVLSELAGSPINRCAGGSAANTIIGVADFGGKAAYAGKTGRDELGGFCLTDMKMMKDQPLGARPEFEIKLTDTRVRGGGDSGCASGAHRF